MIRWWTLQGCVTRVVACSVAILAAPLAVGAIQAGAGKPGAGPTGRCGFSNWSTPRRLAAGDTQNVFLRSPAFATAGRGGFILANSLQMADLNPLRGSLFYGRTLDGAALPDPFGPFLFALPRGAIDRGGVLHVVWAEAATPVKTGLDWINAVYRSLWYSQFSPNAGWSPPQEITNGTVIRWQNASSLEIDSAGTLHFGVPIAQPGKPPRFAHFSKSADGWGERPAIRQGIPNHPVMLAVGSTLFAAFEEPAMRAGEQAGITLLSLEKGRTTWVPAATLPVGPNQRPTDIRLVVSPNTTIHLLAGQRSPGVMISSRIMHFASGDQGRTWVGPDILTLPTPYLSYAAVVDRCEAVHLLFQTMGETGAAQANYARWQNAWLPIVTNPFGAIFAAEPALTLIDGDPFAAWTTIRPKLGAGGGEAVVLSSTMRVRNQPN